jgi:hypothetical protein
MADQGTEYARFIEAQLEYEYDRRDAVNSRSATAITSATGLVTITLVVIAVLKGKDFTLHGGALIALFIAFLGLLVSAVMGVLGGMNWPFPVTSVSTMSLMVGDHWRDSEVTARGVAAFCNVKTINALRAGTNIKYRFLLAAAIAQVVAILALGVSALIVVA